MTVFKHVSCSCMQAVLDLIATVFSPEGDGFEGSLADRTRLLDLRGLQMESHVLQPEEGAVWRRQEQTLKRHCAVRTHRRVHELRLQLAELLLRVLLLLLQLFTGLFHRLARKRSHLLCVCADYDL